MARKASRKLVALSASAILAVYGTGYVLSLPAATHLAALGNSTLDPQRSYRDGTYTGTGSSDFGDVTVSVTIKHRRIAAVAIIHVTTSYAERWIDGLPSAAVSHQSAAVDAVSGATYSSRAFQDAVVQAIMQAAV